MLEGAPGTSVLARFYNQSARDILLVSQATHETASLRSTAAHEKLKRVSRAEGSDYGGCRAHAEGEGAHALANQQDAREHTSTHTNTHTQTQRDVHTNTTENRDGVGGEGERDSRGAGG
jgi:hypothetical protein